MSFQDNRLINCQALRANPITFTSLSLALSERFSYLLGCRVKALPAVVVVDVVIIGVEVLFI